MTRDKQALMNVQACVYHTDKLLNSLIILEKDLQTSTINHATLGKFAAEAQAKSGPLLAQLQFPADLPPVDVYDEI